LIINFHYLPSPALRDEGEEEDEILFD